MLLPAAGAGIAPALYGASRTEQQARRIAEQFLQAQSATLKRSATSALSLAATSATLSDTRLRSVASSETPAWYAYNQGTQAFVIVSGDDRMKDIIGYSNNGSFQADNIPPQLRCWLEAWTVQANCLQDDAPDTAAASYSLATEYGFPEQISPLLGDIQYNQYEPYNLHAPIVNGERSVTGCVATSLASVLSYWRYPVQGTGTHSYTSLSSGINYSFDFGATTFDWDNILPTYIPGEYTPEQADAIATLMYACGIASNTNYSPLSSGAMTENCLNGSARHLGINPYTIYHIRYYFSNEKWMNMLFTELAAGRPILYGGNMPPDGGGHAFVIDGYDTQGMVHVNWGWGGILDGYFELATLNPIPSPTSGFTFMQYMVTGFAPATLLSTPASQFIVKEATFDGNRCHVETLTCMGAYFDGQIAVIAQDSDGTKTPISNILQEQGECGKEFQYIIFNLAEGLTLLEPGTYDVYVASKTEGEAEWTPGCGTEIENPSYQLEVREDHTIAWHKIPLRTMPQAQIELPANLYAGQEFTATVSLHNPGTEKFEGEIFMGFNNPNIYNPYYYLCGRVDLEAGQDTTLTVTDFMFEQTGAYNICVLWGYNYFQFYPLGEKIPVVIQEPTAIETVTTDRYVTDAPVLCSVPGETDIRFRYAGEVETVSLHNLAGQTLRTERAPHHDGDTYTLTGDGLPHGCYILLLHGLDGTTRSLKFTR